MYIMDYFVGPWGGTESQVFELLTNLDQRKFSPCFTVYRSTPYIERTDFSYNIKVLGIEKLVGVATIVRLLKLSRIIRKDHIDLVHIYFNDASLSAPFFCKLGGARVITSRRDMGFWYETSNLTALRFANLSVDRIVANCEAVKGNVYKHEHFPKNKIAVIFNGHDELRIQKLPEFQFRKQWSIGDSDPIIGMVANLSPVKRPLDLLVAFKIILKKYPSACLVLVGGGGEKERAITIEAVRKLGIEDRVRFLGSVIDPVPIIKHFDVGVLCSKSEGLSNAIIEYMGCGKPVVCTNTGGNPELIQDGYNGFLVPVGDVKKLATTILQLIENPSLRSRVGVNARESFLAGPFSVKTMVDSHMSLYAKLLLKNR